MSKIGRNDPCPCGSGKKYKVCCLASANNTDFQFRWFQHLHAGLIPKLIEFASEGFDSALLEAAWLDFNDGEPAEPYHPENPMTVLFMPWFLFNWVIELKPTSDMELTNTTIAELFLLANEEHLTADEELLVRAANRCPYSLFEIVQVQPGVGMTLLDLLRRIQYEIVERSASQTLKRGEISYCANSEVRGFRSNVGTGPFALRPTAKREVLRLRKWMLEQTEADEISAEELLEFEADIRGLYLAHVTAMFTPPRLAKTDGDPLVPQKLYFDLVGSTDDAFHALKDLAKGEKEADLLRDEVFENGRMTKADIPWLGGKEEAQKRLAGPVLLGNIKIDRDTIVADVNSINRAKRIRRLIERRLGAAVKYKTTLIEPIERPFQEKWAAAMAGSSPPSGGPVGSDWSGAVSVDDAPELRALMEETARQHWASWFDLPVPALNDVTPREAAKTEEGRELLESLLLLYESHAQADADNVFKPDIPALRRELGMD